MNIGIDNGNKVDLIPCIVMISFGSDGALDMRIPGKGLVLTTPNGQIKKCY